MNITEEELKEEREYLKKTLEVVNEIIDKRDENIKGQISSINEMKKYIWENAGLLDEVEIAQGMYDVDVDVNTTNLDIKALEKLKRSLSNPYFGRIDFKNDDYTQKIYIGINGIMKDLDFYVFDWRTPIASLFYNYGIGKANYEAPSGVIEGEVTLKRQYKIKNGDIERCFNSDINIDDEYLQEILSTSSSNKMTNIVNTIQKEQNEIIRNIIDKYLLVQGIAGSGKTSVALHRIAYLLYKEKNLTSNNVLIFSPNDVFSEYISDVLPELGEDNVLQSTFSDFASSYIKDYKKIESFTEFIERFYKQEKIDEKKFREIKYKISDEFKEQIDNYLSKIKKNIAFNEGVKINGKEISKEELTNYLVSRCNVVSIDTILDNLSEYICDYSNISYKKYKKIVREKLTSILNTDINIKSLYNNMLNSSEFKEQIGVEEYNLNSSKTLKYEDLLPMMYINFEINGYPTGSNIKHIIIDEAQDYSILQFRLLRKIFKTASFPILGDVNQTINPYYKYDSLDKINEIFDGKGRYLELNKTYRSSEEIISYTNEILNLNNACSVRTSNKIPVVLKDVEKENSLKQLAEDVQTMKEQGMKKIAIITKNNIDTINLYEGLKDDIEISLVDNSGNSSIEDVVILPSYISKGLEFDGVIAYTDKFNLYKEKDKYLFYVVCTRAQHSLTVYNQKQLIK